MQSGEGRLAWNAAVIRVGAKACSLLKRCKCSFSFAVMGFWWKNAAAYVGQDVLKKFFRDIFWRYIDVLLNSSSPLLVQSHLLLFDYLKAQQ